MSTAEATGAVTAAAAAVVTGLAPVSASMWSGRDRECARVDSVANSRSRLTRGPHERGCGGSYERVTATTVVVVLTVAAETVAEGAGTRQRLRSRARACGSGG